MNDHIPKFEFNEPFAGFEKDGSIYLWRVSRLWELSADLPIFEFEVSSFNGFDQDVWFGNQQKPTLNNMLAHFKKIESANYEKPIILNQDGVVLDGVHRLCKAYLEGRKTIPAVKFEVDPTPDKIN
jgi:hypothetical protein